MEDNTIKALNDPLLVNTALELTKIAVYEKKWLGKSRNEIRVIESANDVAVVFHSYYRMLETGVTIDPFDAIKSANGPHGS